MFAFLIIISSSIEEERVLRRFCCKILINYCVRVVAAYLFAINKTNKWRSVKTYSHAYKYYIRNPNV